ncbi:DUF445 domain-containing protein [Clostridium saccharobutylicum]|uniref:DUF445 domain-containing protein n=2 Tax=Clostridium saccharobutylicum TaxID=169679 RepID=U5MXL0_CLOSA|nr:DUF445 domain-containing protein [Clostridium saccharobutylicum]AGX44356.1 hypothetical protein CLSA_c33930 [Clostridium saccharobutylicum DSM 13864]AQR91648.1 hypothetical protein CLOSC_33740 [Clostridium saccharobutylicum]AQS01553.1 hypothetical protein CSACC_33820 [Clostridium saccharobutylicum]AQS15536.1 hypothetical protein CLOSACC_33820 [Clostridium saccharobutylicum]MBA2906931.1 uncharacterized membrane-anchored protein YjiN (DUF445 family) [Clostridium saccharobutylicum]
MKIKTNHKALISLVIMLIGYMYTLFSRNSIMIMLLQSGFEAGLVGGLADWFAVYALFRYPFGISIPHTALLPNNRDRITASLVSMVENNLLNKSSIINKIHELNVVKKFLELCKDKMYSNEVQSGINYITKSVIYSFSTNEISEYIHKTIIRYLNGLESRKVTHVLTNLYLKHNYEDKILDFLLNKLEEVVNREDIENKISKAAFTAIKNFKADGILEHMLKKGLSVAGEEKVGSIIKEFIILIINELKDVDNSNRVMIIEWIRENIDKISNNENIMQKIDEYKENLISSDYLYDYINKIVNKVQSLLLDYIDNGSYIEETILPLLDNLIDNILKDPVLITKLELYVQGQVSDCINNNHQKIGKLVKENVEKLDNEMLIDLIEDKVGDDLQWIRVNGAICGFLIGLVLGFIRIISL